MTDSGFNGIGGGGGAAVTLPVSIANGGTGQASAGAALTALGAASTTNLALVLKPKEGAALTDANTTIQPFTDKASQYTMAGPTTMTTNRTDIIGVTSVPTGMLVRIVRKDTTANTLALTNGGTNGGTIHTFGASPTTIEAMTAYFNGVDWVKTGFEYLVTS